jgi:DNA polymerase-3 subunit gamma/tau
MLLKALKEVELHQSPIMAAEMALIRLAYAASLPSGGELVRLAREGEETKLPPPAQRPRGEPARPLQPEAPVAGSLAIKIDESPPAPTHAQSEGSPPVASFKEIVALAGEKRDIKLKNQLETLVRPIRVAPGMIELALEPQAPSGLPAELARKLEGWTGSRWIVLVAREGGDKPLAAQVRDSRDSLFREVRAHPHVQAVLARFPQAEIVDVREPPPIPTEPSSPEEIQ